jgi:RHS repeat-associated protein
MIFVARFMLALIAAAGMAFSSTAQAQSTPPQGVIGWVSTAGPGGTFPSAYAACQAQWQYYGMDNGYSRFIGTTPGIIGRPGDWRFQACNWTSFQYLCPQETGGSLNECWTVLPSYVNVVCASGFIPTVDGHCRQNPPVEKSCPTCNAAGSGGVDSGGSEPGRSNPTVGNPIVLSTGAKKIDAQDYASADGLFSIGRHYRSFQVGPPIIYGLLPKSNPRWLVAGWNFDFGFEIQLGAFSGTVAAPGANTEVFVAAPDGTGYGFTLNSSGQWVIDPAYGAANAQNNWKLQYVGTLPSDLSTVNTTPSTWTLTDGDDNIWTFTTQSGPNGGGYVYGWPTQKTTRTGYQWNFAYNADSSLASITDSFARKATFTWAQFYVSSLASPPAGSLPYPVAVTSIGLPDGTSLAYTYNPPPATSGASTSLIQQLVKVQHLSSTSAVLDSTTYLYENTWFPTHVTGVVDNLGNRIRTYAYDGLGRTTSSSEASGADSWQVQYGQTYSGSTITANTSRAVNALGKAYDYTFTAMTGGPYDYRLTQIASEASANTSADTATITYGANTYVASQTDQNTNLTTTTRDARGRPLTIVEASGSTTTTPRTTTITWDPTYNVPDTIVRPNVTQTNTYYATGQTGGLPGQLKTVTLTDTTSQTVPYSTNGQTRTWTYTWSTVGKLLTVKGPVGDVTTFTYDSSGNLLTSTDALSHVTKFATFDANGRPATMTDPNNIVTGFTYDGMGRVLTITVQYPGNTALNAVTTVAYDADGQVTGLTLPSTEKLILAYDGVGRVTSMSAANGEQWNFTYDAMDNVTGEVVKRVDGSTSRQVARAFDELARIISQTSGTGNTTRWSYDNLGNVLTGTTPIGNATTASFDALNRVVTTIAPDTGKTTLAYDGQDNVLTNTDPVTVATKFTYDGFGDVIQEVSPDRGTSTYVYNAAGQLTKSTDGRAQVVTYTLDLLGRVTTKVPTSLTAQTVTYTWDTGGLTGSYGVGRLGKIVDGSGTTQFQYDPRGNLLAKQQKIGTTTAAQVLYAYDLNNRITQITYPSGRIVQYAYDTKGRVSLVQTKASASITPWTTIASGYTYEPFGAVDAITLGNGLAVANIWGADGLLTSRRLYKTTGGTNLSYLTYTYDADSNIGSITDQITAANTVLYGYDKVDRLSMAVSASTSSTAQTYAYTTATNRLATLTTSAGARTYTYDGRGNTAKEVRPASVTATTTYDGYARLTGYTRTDVGAYTFTYNGLDDRVTMTNSANGTRTFLYDGQARVLGEYGTSATDVKAEYIWALPSTGTGPFGGTDGVGGYAPLAVATPNSSGTIQLNWVFGNHLGVPLVTTDSTGALATTPNNYFLPGFPGQSRVITDLYYNRYRDYDPTTGRYIQADPIGLGGGSNPYSYARNNPIRWTDPSGRIIPLPIITGLIGGGLGFFTNLGVQLYQNGGNLNGVCWRNAFIAGGVGAIAGAAAPFVATSYLGSALLGATANSVQYVATQFADGQPTNSSSLAWNAGFGAAAGLLGGTITKSAALEFDTTSPYLNSADSAALNAHARIRQNVTTATFGRNLVGGIVGNSAPPYGSTCGCP